MKIDDPNSLVLDPKQAAKLLKISLASVYKGMQTGELPCIKIGRRRLIPRRQFEQLFNGSLEA